MGATREFNFTVGPETSTQPAVGTPAADDDLITKGYADANYLAGSKSIKALGDAGYTITDTDGFDVILVGATANLTGNVTVTLPTLADNNERRLRVVKCDTTAFTVTVDGEGAEVVGPGAATTFVLSNEDDCVNTIGSTDESRWVIISHSAIATASQRGLIANYVHAADIPTVGDRTNCTGGSPSSYYTRVGDLVTVYGNIDITITAGASNTIFSLTVPIARATDFALGDVGGVCTNMDGTATSTFGARIIGANTTKIQFQGDSVGSGLDAFSFHYSYTLS